MVLLSNGIQAVGSGMEKEKTEYIHDRSNV